MRKSVLVAAGLALALAPVAEAKFRVRLELFPARLAAGEPAALVLRTQPALREDVALRVVAIAPGVGMYAALIGLDSCASKLCRRHRFLVPLTRSGFSRRGTVRFPRAGRWLLVALDDGAPGLPPAAILAVRVGPKGGGA